MRVEAVFLSFPIETINRMDSNWGVYTWNALDVFVMNRKGEVSSVAAYNIVVPLFGINTHLKCKQLK